MANTDIRKAAIFLMSLPEDRAAQLQQLAHNEVEAVSIEIAKTSGISGEEQESVIQDFALANPTGFSGRPAASTSRGNWSNGRWAGSSATLDNVRQSIEALPFGFLQKVDSQNLLTFIIDEHPQTIALILSHLPPQQAAEIISGLPADRQIGGDSPRGHDGQTSPEIIKEVERGLEHRMSSVMSQQFENAGGVATVAEILNVIDRATERTCWKTWPRKTPTWSRKSAA